MDVFQVRSGDAEQDGCMLEAGQDVDKEGLGFNF